MANGMISKLIDAQQTGSTGTRRDYIGASIIGSDCLRQIWYEFNGFPGRETHATMLRTLAIGKRLEQLIVDWVKGDAGLLVYDYQHSFKDQELPYFQGHCDAIIAEPHAILEIKTAKNSSYNQFIKNGVLKWMPQYYDQLQAYMGMSGISSAYILVLNKDNSDLCDEKVAFNAERYSGLKEKARMVHDAKSEPPRISGNPSWYQCKMCKFKEICHKGE